MKRLLYPAFLILTCWSVGVPLQARTVAPLTALAISSSAYDAPAGYYASAEGLGGDSLRSALHGIIDGHTFYPYSASGSTDVWDILKDADQDPGNTNNVRLIYNGASVNAAQEYNNGAGWNREHVWPLSLGGFDTTMKPGTDAHNLRACNEEVNARRGNLEYDNGGSLLTIQGLTATYYDSNSFEPNDAFKGDVARIIFYMAVRYEGGAGEPDLEIDDFTNGGVTTFGKLSTLLEWHLRDPVDDFERRRNARIYAYQGNRNPFIDRPDWAHAVFDPNYAPPDFSVDPSQTQVVSGMTGSSFAPLQHVYTIAAIGQQQVAWTVSVDVPWLYLSGASGVLSPGGSQAVSVFVNPATLPTALGSYVGTVRFRNTVTGSTILRQITADVRSPARLVVSPTDALTIRGRVGGPFTPDSWTYTVSNVGATPMDWSATKPTWVNLSTSSGRLEPGQNTTVTATLTSAAASLAQGVYNGSVAFTNLTNGDGNTSRAVTLETVTRDYFAQLFSDAASLDLVGKSVTFTPDGSTDYYRATVRRVNAFPTDPTGGKVLLAYDNYAAYTVLPNGKELNFYGTAYSTLYVVSNGYVTFKDSDSTSTATYANHFNRRRIAGLMTDLNPALGGSFSSLSLPNRFVATWQNVPHATLGGSNSFQIELFYDGRIRITWLGLTSAPGVVGLSSGAGVPAAFAPSDVSAYPPEGPLVESFSPAAGIPGATVTLDGLGYDSATEVLFGGQTASYTVVSPTQITATVPVGATTGPITVVSPDGEGSGASPFTVVMSPGVAAASAAPQALTGFAGTNGVASTTQTFSASAASLPGALTVSAPSGFEVSLDGVNFASTVILEAPVRTDAASNYGAGWTNGSNQGYGFGAWGVNVTNGTNSTGVAKAFIGNPTQAFLTNMATTAFVLQASPSNSGATAAASRPLTRPLAVGEALSFDWGIFNTSGYGFRGFQILSGPVVLFTVSQGNFPGTIFLYEGSSSTGVDTGLVDGKYPMRWTFRQINAQTVRITATSRQGGTATAFTRDVSVPGAVGSFRWFATETTGFTTQGAYFDRLAIEPVVAGGGDVPTTPVHVRLAAGAPVGSAGGEVSLSSNGQVLATVPVSGTVAAPSPYDAWAASHGLAAQGNGAPGEDPDADGHSNWLEFAFGSSPGTPNGSLVGTKVSPQGITFEFLRRKGGVAYNVLHTTNLRSAFGTATNLDLVVPVDQSAVPDGWERTIFTVPAHGTGFYRFNASPN